MSDRKRPTLGSSNGDGPEPIEIEMWGRIFTLRKVTRSVQRTISELSEKLDVTTDDDEAVVLFGDLIDAVAQPANGQRKTAGGLINEKWLADELEVAEIQRFAVEVQEAAAERPT